MPRFKKSLCLVLFCSGLFLLCVNLYGLNQELRPSGLTPDTLRFGELDVTISPLELEQNIVKLDGESYMEFAIRLTHVIAGGLAHVEWEAYDPDRFHQRVPVWENFILYFMGVITTIPEFERYHFTDPYRSLERGIGICGDASMTLSSLLLEEGIKNHIVTIPGHVVVQAYLDGDTVILDADYGVVLERNLDFYRTNPRALEREYQSQLGRYNDGELMIARELASNGYTLWNGASHFVTNKYYFERLSYLLKWILPLLMVCISFYWFKRN